MIENAVKSMKIIIAGILLAGYQLAVAETPLESMIKESGEKMQAGREAVQKSMESAMQKAKADAEAAMAKLPTYSINHLTQDGEPPEPSIDFQWTPQTIKLADQADVKRGEELAKKAKCDKCHGENGVSEEDDTPSIAGQITAYSLKQLHDYKVGLRESREMLKKVRDMTLSDMADVSAYYAKQKREDKLGSTDGNIPVLVNKGDDSRYMLACDSCHNEDSTRRGYQTPIIEGQKIEYFTETMLAFKEGDRVNDHYSLMRAIAEKLTEEEIEELAAYYSAKPVEE